MRAIIIEEERFTEVLALMRSRALEQGSNCWHHAIRERYKITDEEMRQLGEEMFRSINYEFVRWAQSHGASCVRA